MESRTKLPHCSLRASDIYGKTPPNLPDFSFRVTLSETSEFRFGTLTTSLPCVWPPRSLKIGKTTLYKALDDVATIIQDCP